MRAEIIAIGDELTSGVRVDTNSAWLSRRLAEIGIRVIHHSTVADELASCREVFRSAFQRADLVIATGGLGPTADDLTRQAIADAAGCSLQQDNDVLDHIREMFESRGREMPEQNAVQALFPESSEIVPNPHGTAPGIDITTSDESGGARCFALPGVPAEMKEMWGETVLPALMAAGAARRVIVHHELKCFGIGESDCEQRLPDLVRRGREPSVGITVHRATITLRVTSEGGSEPECRAAMQPTIETIRECLGPIVFGEGKDQLQDSVLRELSRQNRTLVTAEWATAGILAGWLAAGSPATRHSFLGGLVYPDGDQGNGSGAGVPTDVSALRGFAEWHRTDKGSDYSIAVGPWLTLGERKSQESTYVDSMESDERDPGEIAAATRHLFIAISTVDGTKSCKVPYRGHPDIIPERTAKKALDILRMILLS